MQTKAKFEFNGGALFARSQGSADSDPLGVLLVAEDKPELTEGLFLMRLDKQGLLTIVELYDLHLARFGQGFPTLPVCPRL